MLVIISKLSIFHAFSNLHLARPEILNLPKHLTFIESQTGSLHCKGKGIPVPKLIWRKNGEKITNYTKYNITTIGGMENRKSTLQIRNLTYDDRGNFSCTMKNRKDFQTKTTVLTVQGERAQKSAFNN